MTKHLARVYSAELEGINARTVEVEVDLHVGLHAFNIVGLADKALSEAKERVNSALKNSGVKPPNRENRKITVNLAPADLRKAGSHYDLAIAVGYLLATNQIVPFETKDKLFIGELALDGRLRPVRGALNIAELALASGFTAIYLPAENANEAAMIQGLRVVPLRDLAHAIALLEEKTTVAPVVFKTSFRKNTAAPDFADVRGQEHAKRALQIAAAGGHNILMVGPPGVGKSMLAQALIGILPDLAHEEAIEVTKIWSAAGVNEGGLVRERPFRAPHQTASPISVVGGGGDPRPGEISLAHRGVLFLDELPEFPKNVLESLRQPMESGSVHVARAKRTLVFPAKFTLVAAMNPCPCGFYGDPERECRCGAYEVIRYQKKISGPLLDRIDLQIRVPRVNVRELRATSGGGTASAAVKKEVEAARAVQTRRFSVFPKNRRVFVNAEMTSRQAEEAAALDAEGELFLRTLDKTRLSPRGYYRLLKTGRTIADLEGSGRVTAAHLAEAFSYRIKEEI